MNTEDYYAQAELGAWSPENDIPWQDLDPELALSRPDILDQIRASALIESVHPITTKHLMGLLWDDVDATSVLSVELFEGFRHFRADFEAAGSDRGT